MNTKNLDCDHKRIDAFLDSGHVSLDDPLVVQHLDTCEACRNYIETQAAETDRWANATRLLKPTEFDHASSVGCSAATIGHQRNQHPIAAKTVVDSLAPSDDPSRLGRLGGYEISGVIGVGGMGVVLKAIYPALDRTVAIKVMAPHLANNGTARKRFSREAKAAAAVLHPNVIPIHSVSSDGPTPYLVMAYIRGGSLQKRLQREGPLTTVEILRIGSQVAAGLSAAHDQGLVHRDIKPENILLEDGIERVTLTDFGLARAVDDASVTREGTIAGTPQYMSPEQARGESVDQRSDLFSLGSVLYALCTGRPPFRGDTSFGVMRRIIDEKAIAIRELNPDIPEWIAQIVDKLMAKDRAKRYASADDVRTLLESCLSHVQQPTSTKLPASLVTGLATTQPSQKPKTFLTLKIGLLSMSLVLIASVLVVTLPSLIGITGNTDTLANNEDKQILTNDLDLFQGRWKVDSATAGGKQVLAADKDARLPDLQITGDTFYKIEAAPMEYWHSFRTEIDSTKKPKTIDLISNRDPNDRVVGIYEIEEDVLKICFDDLDGVNAARGPSNPEHTLNRPTKFEAPAGSKHVLFVCRLWQGEISDLLQREGEGLLTKAQDDKLVKLILERQADRTLSWSTQMGDLIEQRWVAGKLDRKLWEQYTAEFVVDYLKIKVRPRIVIGTPNGVNLQLWKQNVRCGSGKHITFRLQQQSWGFRIGGTLIGTAKQKANLGTINEGGQTYMGFSCGFEAKTWDSIKPGRQTISYEVQLAILESSATDKDEKPDVFASRKVSFETETTFLPPGQSTVNINTDPAMKAEVDRSITIKRIETSPAVNPPTDNKYYSNIILDVKRRPIDIAFEIILKDGDNEYRSGAVTSAADNDNGFNGVAYIAADLSGKRIDVIFRPAPGIAEDTVGLFEIWGEEIVVKDVLVR